MKLVTESYFAQVKRWPTTGRYILAQFDDDSVIVYQAYRPAIGHFAASQGYFGGEFRLNRMSWIKPNFLWMMYRSGWGQKSGQEVVLAVRIKRDAFEEILRAAVYSSFVPEVYGSDGEWQESLKHSPVRLQWDPDHHPNGEKQERRAIQLGLKGQFLASYAKDWVLDIEDISPFVQQQYRQVQAKNWEQLLTPRESVYRVNNEDVREKLQLSTE